MTEEEIYEELEITYGKPPRTTSEKNMIWLKGVLEEHIIEGEFNEDVPKPSLDALAMTQKKCNFAPSKVYLGSPVAPICTINKMKSSSSCLQLGLVFFVYDKTCL